MKTGGEGSTQGEGKWGASASTIGALVIAYAILGVPVYAFIVVAKYTPKSNSNYQGLILLYLWGGVNRSKSETARSKRVLCGEQERGLQKNPDPKTQTLSPRP